MKYTIRKSIRISKSIKNAWQIMEQEEEVTPFLYYDFMKHVYWQTMLFSLWSPMIYYITDERNRILLIAPMKHHIFSGEIDTLGNVGFCDITDFLYSKELNAAERKECVMLLRDYIGRSFNLSRLNENSQTLTYLQDHVRLKSKCDCVNIHFDQDYDNHIVKMSKSVKQNLRTAYNRLNKNGCIYDFKFFIGAEQIPPSIKKDTKRIYFKRQKECYSRGMSMVAKMIHLFAVKYLRHDNHSLYENTNSANASLYINGKIAAFWAGVVNKHGDRVVIPRLAIDDEYRFYSPGYILLSETMKHLDANRGGVRNVDLCRGTEKYKIDLGGMVYTSLFVEVL